MRYAPEYRSPVQRLSVLDTYDSLLYPLFDDLASTHEDTKVDMLGRILFKACNLFLCGLL